MTKYFSSLTAGRWLGRFVGLAAVLLLNACQPAKWQEVASDPNTGHPETEKQVGDVQPGTVRRDQTIYVAPERIRVRNSPEQNPDDSSATLDQGDQVRVLDPVPQGPDGLIKVEVVETRQTVSTAPVYIPIQYLQTNPVQAAQKPRYIMIQNIATEKLRVYQLFDQGFDQTSKTAGQPNHLIFETDMIAGENNPAKTRRTSLGSYRIESWSKFYEDAQHIFPSWFDPSYPELPLPGQSLEAWTSPSYMPAKRAAVARGAFGWYTAKIGPNAYQQWTHGTLGWGVDGDRFIQISRSQLAQYYSDPRSFGCTRVENRAIAFLQDLLPVGTPVLKIYARETLADPKLNAYASQKSRVFEFVLSKDQVRSLSPQSSRKDHQLARNLTENMILEEGSYTVDQRPDAVEFSKNVKGDKLTATIVRAEANLYDIPRDAFNGEFFVDEGLLKGYSHPKGLRVGGFSDRQLPGVVLKR